MIHELNGRKIRIPDSDLQTAMQKYHLTQAEAIEMWLEDEGYLDNPEELALTQKAKENRITATIHQASAKECKKKTQKERVHKDNPLKEGIVASLAMALEAIDGVSNIKVENPGKLITFSSGGESFKLDLVQKRKPKGGGK